MTKEIIVDNVDVAGCEFYVNRTGYCIDDNHSPVHCKERDGCIYKQLNRLQAENEKLKAKCKELNKKILDADAGKSQYSFYLDKEEKENRELRKALEEIRELAKGCKNSEGIIRQTITEYLIQNKINEVLK